MATPTPFEKVMQLAYQTGQFWNPDNPNGFSVGGASILQLDPSHPVAKSVMRSLSLSMADAYVDLCREEHGRNPHFDGEFGPAMARLADIPRCMVPDYAPPPGVQFSFSDPALQEVAQQMQDDYGVAAPKLGNGNWAGCHGVGDFHCAVARWNSKNFPSHLGNGAFEKVLSNVQKAYAKVGLLWLFIDSNGKDIITGRDRSGIHVNTECSFVNSSDGWIGLAIVGQRQSCQSNIWAQFLAPWKGGNSEAGVINEWTSLVLHELGHNCGMNHTRGGHMNATTTSGLPPYWYDSDPSVPTLKARFGGEEVAIPDDEPTPPIPPAPPTEIESLQRRVQELEAKQRQDDIRNAIQDAFIQELLSKV